MPGLGIETSSKANHLLAGLFLAIPFGILADKYGRKWLSVVNVTSIWARAVSIFIVCEFTRLTHRPRCTNSSLTFEGAFPQVLPLRLVWLQSALAVFGGGSIVASALFLVIATDVTPKSQR